jgi:hypothetical protein
MRGIHLLFKTDEDNPTGHLIRVGAAGRQQPRSLSYLWNTDHPIIVAMCDNSGLCGRSCAS